MHEIKLLYAEDEPGLAMAVQEILKMNGYAVTHAADGAEALAALQTDSFDAAILDIMMPRMSGMDVLEQMRSRGIDTPVLLLTAKSELDDRVDGLTAGADDYLTKPFAMKELLARITALLRRSQKSNDRPLVRGNVTLLPAGNELRTQTGSLRLSRKETELLELLLAHPEEAYSAEQLALQIWKDAAKTDTAELYLSYLNTKLGQLQAELTIIRLENGVCLKAREAYA